MMTKSEIVTKMQGLVQNFDFEMLQRNNSEQLDLKQKNETIDSHGRKTMVYIKEEHFGMIAFTSKIYEPKYKQYNYSAAYYYKNDKILNPKLILRFECHQINDMQCIRLPVKEDTSSCQ